MVVLVSALLVLASLAAPQEEQPNPRLGDWGVRRDLALVDVAGRHYDVAGRFRRWEQACTGASLGAEPEDARAGDPRPARELFQETFGAELEALEAGFREYVAALTSARGR